MKILVVNTGSTSVKLALMDAGGEQPVVIHSASLAANDDDPKQALQDFLSTGAYQLTEVLKASGRLTGAGIHHSVVYLREPAAFTPGAIANRQ